ncbi:MAG: hypothetical protein QW177_06480 [Candidatus Nitrosotenuis sp.]
MLQKSYKEYIKLNKNLIIAFAVAISLSALVAQLLSEEESHVNSTYTVVVDFVTFYSTFGGLFYLDNRKKYKLETGKTDAGRLKKDLVKIISSLGVGEVVYLTARWLLQYYFLSVDYEAYKASVIAHVISTIIYIGVVNLGVKLTRLYKDGA